MGFSFKKSFLAVAFAASAALFSGCESKVDRERKPSVANPMIENSIQTRQLDPSDTANYADKLRCIFMGTYTKDLETIRDAGITVLLDRRLSEQTYDFFDSRIEGVYYVNDKIVTLYDNGQPRSEEGFLKLDATDNGRLMLEELAVNIRNGDVPPGAEFMFCASYTRFTGKTTSTYSEWRSADHFDQGSIAKNPQLLKPPVKAVQQAPKTATPDF